jgi:hypothetical protein
MLFSGCSAILNNSVLCHKKTHLNRFQAARSASKENDNDIGLVADLSAHDFNFKPVAGVWRNQYHEYRHQPWLSRCSGVHRRAANRPIDPYRAGRLLAFEILKWCGAAYLIWLGICQWRTSGAINMNALASSMPRRKLFKRAVLVNLTNPKSIVFLAALFPQFIIPHQPQIAQYLVLGVTTVVVDIIVMIGYATLAKRIAGWIKAPKQMTLLNRIFGSLFMMVGLLLATARKI